MPGPIQITRYKKGKVLSLIIADSVFDKKCFDILSASKSNYELSIVFCCSPFFGPINLAIVLQNIAWWVLLVIIRPRNNRSFGWTILLKYYYNSKSGEKKNTCASMERDELIRIRWLLMFIFTISISINKAPVFCLAFPYRVR